MKRKLANTENEHKSKDKRLKISSQDNSEEASGCTRSSISVPKATELFHQNISVGPEYICTCCDQLWYKSSVSKCTPSLYQSCTKKF